MERDQRVVAAAGEAEREARPQRELLHPAHHQRHRRAGARHRAPGGRHPYVGRLCRCHAELVVRRRARLDVVRRVPHREVLHLQVEPAERGVHVQVAELPARVREHGRDRRRVVGVVRDRPVARPEHRVGPEHVLQVLGPLVCEFTSANQYACSLPPRRSAV